MPERKMPHLDRLVGVPKEHERELEERLSRAHVETGAIFEDGFEQIKTQRDLEIVHEVENCVKDLFLQYGREAFDVSDDNIHIFREGGTREFTKGRSAGGAHATKYGSVLVDRKKSDLEFACILAHELFHLFSYSAVQVTGHNEFQKKKLTDYRSGVSIHDRMGQKKYFEALDEALTETFTELVYERYLKHSDLFRLENEAGVVPKFARAKEREKFQQMIEMLYERRKDRFSSREEIRDLFLKAKLNGQLLEISRLIEETFGPGSFRKIAETTV